MPYALFTNDEKISKAFPTEHEVWKHADEAGLVIDVRPDDDEGQPKRVLDQDYTIKPCEADALAEQPAPRAKERVSSR
ncbi:hypothetical protein [Bradyrhizobium sp. SYSU BS000235]|uniref:hypothetical protein n=1 Tax=Bradyrhizobium sp. SYSU BS000235 TaxID=3411332 RepID=UPI003C725FFE